MPTVLISEPNPLTLEALIYALEAEGYIAVPITTPFQARQILDGVSIDLLIVTLEPDDPESLYLTMDAKGLQRHIKIIVVSGRGLSAGLHSLVDAHIRTPLTMQHIVEAASRLTRSKSRT